MPQAYWYNEVSLIVISGLSLICLIGCRALWRKEKTQKMMKQMIPPFSSAEVHTLEIIYNKRVISRVISSQSNHESLFITCFIEKAARPRLKSAVTRTQTSDVLQYESFNL